MSLKDELARHLALDESMWRMWRENGVTENTPLVVDFNFYSSRKVLAELLADSLRGAGLQNVEVRPTRTLWFFKGWVITGVETGTWSLQRLQDCTRTFCELAAICRTRLEGCGAMMPDKKDDEPGAA